MEVELTAVSVIFFLIGGYKCNQLVKVMQRLNFNGFQLKKRKRRKMLFS